MVTIAITHVPSPRMNECVVTHVERRPIDVAIAQRQHEAYRRALAECGAEVRLLDVNAAMPDCVFIEDTAVVLDELAIMTSPGAPSRRGEPAGIEIELAKDRRIVRIEAPATLDGGDVLRVGKTILVGASSRTNALGAEALDEHARPLGYDVRVVAVKGCLHLKSACTALPDGRLLVNPAWLDVESLRDFDREVLGEDEPAAANVVVIGQAVCMSAAYPRTAERIRRLGFAVQTIDLSEFAKAEGCATCLSLIFSAAP